MSKQLQWAASPDGLRPGVHVHSAMLGAGFYIVAQEIRVAEGGEPAEWGWVICDPDGYPVHMRNGYTDKDGRKAVDITKEAAAAFCVENGIE